MSNQVCGTCYYLGFKNLEKFCRHPDHPFVIRQWDIDCPDWYDMFDKEPLKKRPERLPLEVNNARSG